MDFPENLKYTKDHEWVRVEGNSAYVGVTEFAQQELGDIVYIEVDTLDEDLEQGDVFGTIEAVKTVSDLFIPLSGKVAEFNESLDDTPEAVNSDPYSKGWIIKIDMADATEVDGLLDSSSYKEIIDAN